MMHMQYRQETSTMNNETFVFDAETIKQNMTLKAHQASSARSNLDCATSFFFAPNAPAC